jgi:uncharacterized coiled-coil protein SlyX
MERKPQIEYLNARINALENKVSELEAKLEVQQQNIEEWNKD